MSSEKAANDSPVSCRNCGEKLSDWGVFVVYGEFDPERQGFAHGDHTYHVCNSCWHAEYDCINATQYEPTDSDELFGILNHSDGRLVADFSAFFIPGPFYARVLDGEVQCATVRRTVDHHEEGHEISHEPEWVDEPTIITDLVDRDKERDIPIYLWEIDDTPFADLI